MTDHQLSVRQDFTHRTRHIISLMLVSVVLSSMATLYMILE
jgi:hypothetical protein